MLSTFCWLCVKQCIDGYFLDGYFWIVAYYFEQVKKNSIHFAGFNQVKKIHSHFADFKQISHQKELLSKKTSRIRKISRIMEDPWSKKNY